MPKSNPSPSTPPEPSPPAPASAEGQELLEIVNGLRGELDSLKLELQSLRPAPVAGGRPPAEPETVEASPVPTLELVTNDSPVDAESFAAEFELAIATPEPIPDDLGADDGAEAEQETVYEDPAETLAKYPELNDVIRAFEEQDARSGADASSDADLGEGDVAVSEEEIAALLEATTKVTAPDEPTAVDPVAEGAREMVESEGGTALSEEEIAALLAQTAPVEPADPVFPEPVVQPEPVPALSEADLVSADEIKHMLGVVDPEDNSVPVAPVPQLQAVDPEPKTAPVEAEVEQDGDAEVPVWDGVMPDLDAIDPSAVARVPALLAAVALAVPVCVLDDRLHCLSVEPFDQAGLDAIAKSVGLAVVPHAGDIGRVVSEIRARYGCLDETVVRTPDDDGAPAKVGFLARVLRRAG